MASLQWTIPPQEAWGQLATAYRDAIYRGVVGIVKRRAPEIEDWMKANAPWTDRTGNARQTLHTEIEELVNQMVILWLAHGVYYGIFLELCNAGRFAIVTPSLDIFGPIIWNDVKAMLGV